MILDQRALHGIIDISVVTNDYRTGSYVFPYQAGQYLYLASIVPFNNVWIELGVPNTEDVVVTPQMWWGGGDGWVNAVDVIDGTNGLKQSGRLQWNTDIDKGWQQEYRSYDIPGLTSTKIYSMYWMRFSWDLDLDPLTEVKYIGQKFSSDTVLRSFYPDLLLARTMGAFQTGKTTWEEQHYMAAEHIVRDLRKKDIIKARGQLLDHGLFVDASCHKVAELAYSAFGIPYYEHVKSARALYSEAVNLKFYNTDKNADGRLDPVERNFKVDFMTR